jgi:alkylation response protein AidB-like acyl-CoA dehydrogenase
MMDVVRVPPTKSERTRQRILDAAAEVLAERGYADARLTDIAGRAGMQGRLPNDLARAHRKDMRAYGLLARPVPRRPGGRPGRR